uniref:Protein kinase domain-containing protein n=1 Tax=Macrostomum lignano TaxID=282301 RepID=A0A1I8JDQ2_9PLAT
MDLMHSDVWQLMQNRQLTLRKRIWFGLQLARALEFLHSSSLIPSRCEAAKFAAQVDAELTTVRLTDFGLLKSTGLTGQSLVGTPIYLAPEMVTNSSYDISADVYSLGIALWYLCEGSGSKHPKYVEVMPSVGAILLAGSMNSRPDRLPCIPADLWDLMERCWDAQPRNRPPAKEPPNRDPLTFAKTVMYDLERGLNAYKYKWSGTDPEPQFLRKEKSSEEEATTGLPTEDSSSS